jgi:hypothetical protein
MNSLEQVTSGDWRGFRSNALPGNSDDSGDHVTVMEWLETWQQEHPEKGRENADAGCRESDPHG